MSTADAAVRTDLVVSDLNKTWHRHGQPSVQVLRNFSYTFKAATSYAIIGRNGCGKSSLFDILSGIDAADSGMLVFGAGRKPVASVVFQNYRESLIPWLSVRENIVWPVRKMLKEPGPRQRLDRALALVEKRMPLDRVVSSLSGGQAQLVAVARAWAFMSDMLLCDEPFSALDVLFRQELGRVLADIVVSEKPIAITVTHDIHEALNIANRVLIVSGPPLRVVSDLEIAAMLPRAEAFVGSDAYIGALAAVQQSLREMTP